jgi:hypothetical protein
MKSSGLLIFRAALPLTRIAGVFFLLSVFTQANDIHGGWGFRVRIEPQGRRALQALRSFGFDSRLSPSCPLPRFDQVSFFVFGFETGSYP